jgi:hypothetical protein
LDIGVAASSVVLAALDGSVPVMLAMLAHFRGDEPRADALLSRAMRETKDAQPRRVMAAYGGAWLAACRKDPHPARISPIQTNT